VKNKNRPAGAALGEEETISWENDRSDVTASQPTRLKAHHPTNHPRRVVLMAYEDEKRVRAWLDAGHGRKLSMLERIVLFTVAEYVNSKTGLSWPGHERVITRWGMGKSSLKRAIAKLTGLGLLEIAEHGYHGKYSRYRLAGDLIDTSKEGAHTETLSPEEAHTETLRAHSETLRGPQWAPNQGIIYGVITE
jgi:hypothetical protein